MSDDVKAEVGGKFSIGAAWGRTQDTLDALSTGIDKLHKYLEPNRVQSPILRRYNWSKTAPAVALAYTFIDCGAPPAGRVWDIRRYAVSGPDPFLTLAGVAVIAFTAVTVPQDSNTEPPFQDLVDPSSNTVPNSATWGRDELTLLNQEHLILGLKGLANGQVLQVSLQVEEWSEEDKWSWMAP